MPQLSFSRVLAHQINDILCNENEETIRRVLSGSSEEFLINLCVNLYQEHFKHNTWESALLLRETLSQLEQKDLIDRYVFLRKRRLPADGESKLDAQMARRSSKQIARVSQAQVNPYIIDL